MKVTLRPDTASFARATGKLHQKKKFAIQAGKDVVHETAETIFKTSQLVIPRQTGALAASGKVVHQDTANVAVSVIGYGDSSTNPATGATTASYAVAKHEAPTNGKWLENAVLDCSGLYRINLRDKISKALSQ
jgi:hypothetical protein